LRRGAPVLPPGGARAHGRAGAPGLALGLALALAAAALGGCAVAPAGAAESYETVLPATLAGRAKTIVNKPISVTDEYGGPVGDLAPDEHEAGFSATNVLKVRLKSSSMSALWARSAASEKDLAALKPGDTVTVYGKVRQFKLSDGALHYFFVADSVAKGAASGAGVPVAAAATGTFATARAMAPKSMPFVAARKLAMQPEEFDGAYVSTEARFVSAAANVGDGPDAAEFPAVTTLKLVVAELPFPVYLEKKADWVARMVELDPGTPVAVWGRLVGRPGKTYALVALNFDVPTGRTKPKTK